MIDIKFSNNWNKKLDCNAFTTIRLYNLHKHFKGQSVRILLKDQFVSDGFIQEVSTFYLDQINEFVAFLDTGYSAEETKNIIRRMYPAVDFKKQLLALILITKTKQSKAA